MEVVLTVVIRYLNCIQYTRTVVLQIILGKRIQILLGDSGVIFNLFLGLVEVKQRITLHSGIDLRCYDILDRCARLIVTSLRAGCNIGITLTCLLVGSNICAPAISLIALTG